MIDEDGRSSSSNKRRFSAAPVTFTSMLQSSGNKTANYLLFALKFLLRLVFNSQIACLIWTLVLFGIVFTIFFIIFGAGPHLYYRTSFYVSSNCTIIDFTLQSYMNASRPWEPATDDEKRVRGVWRIMLNDGENATILDGYYECWPREWDVDELQYAYMVSDEGKYHINVTLPTCLVYKSKRNRFVFIDPNHVTSYQIGPKTLGYAALVCIGSAFMVIIAVSGFKFISSNKRKQTKKEKIEEELEEEEALRHLFGDDDDDTLSDGDLTTSYSGIGSLIETV